MSRPLPRDFYQRDTITVARELLGKLLVHGSREGRCAGLIVETEAYLYPDDPDNHAYRGRTQRNASMYLPGGVAYVYFLYGFHWLLNAVTREGGVPEAVLIRALEPREGLDLMRRRRGKCDDRVLTSGPARLTQALGIDGTLDCADLCQGRLMILDGDVKLGAIGASSRVGCRRTRERLLRFFVVDNPHVSRGPSRRGDAVD